MKAVLSVDVAKGKKYGNVIYRVWRSINRTKRN